MSKMLQFGLISLLLLISSVGAIISAFTMDSVASIIVLVIVGISLILGGLYFLIFGLAFKFGKKIKAKIVDKVYIVGDIDEHIGNSYYRYEYESISNNKSKKGKFRIYYTDKDIISALNIGDEIEVNKFLFITNADSNEIIDVVRETNKDNPVFQQQLSERNKFVKKNFKRDMIVGISIFALIVICCLIYVFSVIK